MSAVPLELGYLTFCFFMDCAQSKSAMGVLYAFGNEPLDPSQFLLEP